MDTVAVDNAPLLPLSKLPIVTLNDLFFNCDDYQWILVLVGSLHTPNKLGYIFHSIWKYSLYVAIAADIILCLITIPVPHYRNNLVLLLTLIAALLQAIILLPVVVHANKRLCLETTEVQQIAFRDTLRQSSYFLGSCSTVGLVGSVLMILFYSIYDSHTELLVPIASFVMALFLPQTITLLSFWAVFFIIFDAKCVQLELAELIRKANYQEITMGVYLGVYYRLQKTLGAAQSLCDSIALVCYINMLVCILIIFFENNNIMYDAGFALLFLREGLILGFCFPAILKANELQEKFDNELAEQQDLTDVDMQVNHARIWMLAKQKPLHILILGRKIVTTELRFQIFGFIFALLLGFSSLLMRYIFD